MNRPNGAWIDWWVDGWMDGFWLMYACMLMIERAIWDVGLYNSEKLAL